MRSRAGAHALASLEHFDLALCVRLNRVERRALVRALALFSRLGDGVVRYSLLAALPVLYGPGEWPHIARLAAAGVTCLVLYKLIKRRAARPRPFVTHAEVVPRTLPLDLHAFPSGHTMHAVVFSLLLAAEHPELSYALVPFTLLVALSRVALGLHYPSDVAARTCGATACRRRSRSSRPASTRATWRPATAAGSVPDTASDPIAPRWSTSGGWRGRRTSASC
jgi:undecaprenyl-diphosphatase